MDIRFINGSTVNRFWRHGGTELLGGFQYEADAIEFARAKLAQDAHNNWTGSFYVVHSTCSGKMTVVRHEPSPQESADAD